MFRFEQSNGDRVPPHISGKMRLPLIRILPEAKVLLGIKPYELTRGPITFL